MKAKYKAIVLNNETYLLDLTKPLKEKDMVIYDNQVVCVDKLNLHTAKINFKGEPQLVKLKDLSYVIVAKHPHNNHFPLISNQVMNFVTTGVTLFDEKGFPSFL